MTPLVKISQQHIVEMNTSSLILNTSVILNQNVEKEKRKDAYKCNICHFESGQANKLRRHMNIHDKHSDEESFKCNMCEYAALRKINLRRHKKVHFGSIKKKNFEEKSFQPLWVCICSKRLS